MSKPALRPCCGAKKRNGEPCRAAAMKSGRCRIHGGLSPGAPKGNTNRKTHGFYVSALSAEEQALWPAAMAQGPSSAALEQELAMMRIKLRRLLEYANDSSLAARIEQEVDVLLKSGVMPNGTSYDRRELKTTLPRVGALINEAVDQIRKLSLSIVQMRLQEKELAAEQADNDTEIVFNINVVEGKPA